MSAPSPRGQPPWAIVLLALLLASACAKGPALVEGVPKARAAPPRPYALLALDEAFAAARPLLSKELARLRLPGMDLRRIAPVIREGVAPLLGEIDKAKGPPPALLVLSPLYAAALAGSGLPMPVVAPEWMWPPGPGLFAVATDAVPAYAEAGGAAGSFIAALRAEGGSPVCGLVFSEGPSRPRAVLEAFAAAFAAAFEAASGSPPGALLVRELPPHAEGKPGSEAQSASADELAAEDAVRELLGADLRVLMLSLGSSLPAALRAASRPGLVLGGQAAGPERPAALAFRITPDEAGLAAAVGGAAGEAARNAAGGTVTAVPARLEAGRLADEVKAGARSFASFLAEARKPPESASGYP